MKKPFLILSHLLYWAATIPSTPYLFFSFWFLTHWIQRPSPPDSHGKYYLEVDYLGLLSFATMGACIFYASYFSLNFFVKRPLRFTWIVLFYIVCTLVISLPADLISRQAGMMLGPILYFNLCGFLFRACVEWFKDRTIRNELEKDRETSRLELLKSKIDPHFLFNNLNNIDVFIQEDPQRASEYLKKLSDILRFMLYEANIEKIPLASEIDYINKYIDLQKIRTSNVNFVKFEINGNASNKRIAPMILIHFIENAFKYATNKKIEEAVVVRIDISEKRMTFLCKNHISSTYSSGQVRKGLGIQLLSQKLELLYKKDYKLITMEENNWYIVTLDIQLDED